LVRRNYAQLKLEPSHPSLHYNTVANGRFQSVRVGLYYGALGLPVPGGVHWFWIGTHGEYDKLIG
jgi:hypothetical protein